MVGGISTSLAVFYGTEEEEEGDPGGVSDGDFFSGGYLGNGVQGWYGVKQEGMYSCWGRIFLLIGCQLASQLQVKFPHAVIVGVIGPRGYEYLTNAADVLLEQ